MAHSEIVQALARGIDMIRFVAESEHGLLLAELAERLQVRPPTAFNLARTLVGRGFLEKTSRPVRYRLGPGIAELFALQQRRHWIRQAETVVHELFQQVQNAVVILAEPRGDDLVVNLRMDPTRPEVLERGPGRALSPYANAAGLCFLAFAATAEADAYRRKYPFVEHAGRLWKDENAMRPFLADAKAKGFVVVTGDHPFRVAAPVFGPGRQLVALLGASFNREPAPPPAKCKQMATLVADSARRLSLAAVEPEVSAAASIRTPPNEPS